MLAAGGLCVIGTERHESRRIDNQLRGRSGRQGDPGETQFYLSLEDDLMRLFAGDRVERIQDMMVRADMPDDMPIKSKMVTKAVESAQRKVEEINFSMRKNVLDYDDVMNIQRQTIYEERNKILDGKDISSHVAGAMADTVDARVAGFCPDEANPDGWDLEGLRKWVVDLTGRTDLPEFDEDADVEDISDVVLEFVKRCYDEKADRLGEAVTQQLSAQIMLRVIDTRWMSYLQEMDYLKTGIGLRGFGQRDPLAEYKSEAHAAFRVLRDTMYEDFIRTILRIQITQAPAEEDEPESYRNARFSGPADVDGDQADSALRRTSAAHPRPSAAQGGKAAGGADEPAKPKTYRKDLNDPYANVGRNDPCPCGSGKKFKNCHGRRR